MFTKMRKNKKITLREMLLSWQAEDLVKAERYYHYIERENRDAYARGWRSAIQSVIEKLDEFDL
jgi:hypothetical protein